MELLGVVVQMVHLSKRCSISNCGITRIFRLKTEAKRPALNDYKVKIHQAVEVQEALLELLGVEVQMVHLFKRCNVSNSGMRRIFRLKIKQRRQL